MNTTTPVHTKLTLTRKRGEGIRIGQDVVVTVAELRGGKVRLTIAAPQDVRILRAELEHEK